MSTEPNTEHHCKLLDESPHSIYYNGTDWIMSNENSYDGVDYIIYYCFKCGARLT